MGQKLSRFVVVLAVFISGWFFWFYSRDKIIFHGDALGYYAYLPAPLSITIIRILPIFPGQEHRSLHNYLDTWLEGRQ